MSNNDSKQCKLCKNVFSKNSPYIRKQHRRWEVIVFCSSVCGYKGRISKGSRTHGMSNPATPLYMVWRNMKNRCLNKHTKDYHLWGGRGITVCQKWLKFEGFYEDMFSSYKKGLTLDRIDNNGNYCKENCHWATQTEQANNTRNIERARRYSYNGRSLTVSQWAGEIGLKRNTLHMRLQQYMWPVEKALNQPIL